MNANKRRTEEFSYVKIRLLGAGQFGKAYLAKRSDGKECVIKQTEMTFMSAEEKMETIKEARILELLNHPNIIRFFEVYRTKKDQLCIVMDYAPGGDLKQRLEKQHGHLLPESQIIAWFCQIARALKHVHDRKIIHRDIKSQNIFLKDDKTLLLGDFGIARILSYTGERVKSKVGTPFYISPEIMQGKAYSIKTDIWSLGIVLYEMCSLKPPFTSTNIYDLAQIVVDSQYKPIPRIYSPELAQLVASLLCKEPLRRPTIDEVLRQPIVSNYLQTFLYESLAESQLLDDLKLSQNQFSPFDRHKQQRKQLDQFFVDDIPSNRAYEPLLYRPPESRQFQERMMIDKEGSSDKKPSAHRNRILGVAEQRLATDGPDTPSIQLNNRNIERQQVENFARNQKEREQISNSPYMNVNRKPIISNRYNQGHQFQVEKAANDQSNKRLNIPKGIQNPQQSDPAASLADEWPRELAAQIRQNNRKNVFDQGPADQFQEFNNQFAEDYQAHHYISAINKSPTQKEKANQGGMQNGNIIEKIEQQKAYEDKYLQYENILQEVQRILGQNSDISKEDQDKKIQENWQKDCEDLLRQQTQPDELRGDPFMQPEGDEDGNYDDNFIAKWEYNYRDDKAQLRKDSDSLHEQFRPLSPEIAVAQVQKSEDPLTSLRIILEQQLDPAELDILINETKGLIQERGIEHFAINYLNQEIERQSRKDSNDDGLLPMILVYLSGENDPTFSMSSNSLIGLDESSKEDGQFAAMN